MPRVSFDSIFVVEWYLDGHHRGEVLPFILRLNIRRDPSSWSHGYNLGEIKVVLLMAEVLHQLIGSFSHYL